MLEWLRDFFPDGWGHLGDDGLGLHADGADAGEEVDDFFFVVDEAVTVELFADGGVAWFAFFVAVEDPFEGGAVAEFVCPRCGRDVAEGGEGVQFDGAIFFVGFEFGFVCFACFFGVLVCADEGGGGDGFVVEV